MKKMLFSLLALCTIFASRLNATTPVDDATLWDAKLVLIGIIQAHPSLEAEKLIGPVVQPPTTNTNALDWMRFYISEITAIDEKHKYLLQFPHVISKINSLKEKGWLSQDTFKTMVPFE